MKSRSKEREREKRQPARKEKKKKGKGLTSSQQNLDKKKNFSSSSQQEIKRFVLDYSSAEKKGLKVSVDAFEGPEAAMRALERAAGAYREVYLPKRPRTG